MSLVSVTDLGSVVSVSSASAGGGGVDVDFDATLLIMVALFVFLWIVLKPLLFDPMLRLFEERERRVDGNKLLARKIDEKSAGALATYESGMQQGRDRGERGARSHPGRGAEARGGDPGDGPRADGGHPRGGAKPDERSGRRGEKGARGGDDDPRRGLRVARARSRGARMKRFLMLKCRPSRASLGLAVVIATFLGGAPAVAYAVQTHGHAPPPPHAVAMPPRDMGDATAKAAEEGGGAVEAEHAPKPINWTDFSNNEQPPLAFMLVNFVVLIGIYYKYGKGPIAEGLKNRRATIAREIEEAQRMRNEAEARAEKYQAEARRHLEDELKEARESLEAAGEGRARPHRARGRGEGRRGWGRTRSSSSSRS